MNKTAKRASAPKRAGPPKPRAAAPKPATAVDLDEGFASLTDHAYKALEELIVTLELTPGQVLSEATLSTMLGIGRTPVREALHRLAREGLVVVLPRRGILVSEFNVKSHLRMLEVRRVVERLLMASAAARANDEERARFRDLAREMRKVASEGDDYSFMRLDAEFNALVATAARNEYATSANALMAGLSRRFWFMHHRQADDTPLAAERHAAIAEAIAEGDADAAAEASDALVGYMQGITRAAIDW